MTETTRQARINRIADLAREAEDRAGAMAGRARAGDHGGPYAARLAILARRATDLAETHADLSGAIREGGLSR